MKIFQKFLKFILPLLFGVGIFYFLLQKVDLGQVMEVLKNGISYFWLAVSLFLALLSHIVRGIRWRLQIKTLGVNPSLHDMSVSVFGNYGLNLVFPRLGEIWRCNFIAQVTNKPFTTTLGTMISERIVDMCISACIALFAFVLESQVFFKLFEENGTTSGGVLGLIQSPKFWVAIVILLILTLVALHFFNENPVFKYIKGLVQNIWYGILSLKDLPNKWTYFAYTILLWGLYYLNSYTSLFFFDFTSQLTPLQGLLVFIMGSLSLIVPVQGGLGAWHAMVVFTLGCYGLSTTEAFSYAIVNWCIQEGFVLLLGLYAMIVVMLKKSK